jgi:ATP-dependent Clp protease ATP-binding subunit ClpA
MVTPGNLPQTPRARQVIEYAFEEARNFNHNYVGTEHLLLGLLREWEGVAAQVLMNLGYLLDNIRADIRSLIESPSYRQEQTAAESVQCLPSRSSDENIQRAQEIDHLQDAPPASASAGDLLLNPPDLERLVFRPGLLARMGNLLRWLVGAAVRDQPTYQTPPGAKRYTPRARLVLYRACVEASRMNHEYLGTEHLLLGLLNEGMAARVLDNLGIAPWKVRIELARIVHFGPEERQLPRVLPWTPRALRVLENACVEANESKHEFVGTEHLLLGIMSEEEGVGGQVLLYLGLTQERVYVEIQRYLGWPD